MNTCWLKVFPLVMPMAGSMAVLGQSTPRFKAFSHMKQLRISYDKQERRGLATLYRGNVVVETPTTIIRADELDFDSATQQAELRGSVTIRFVH